MSETIDPTAHLTITLPAQQWEIVLSSLAMHANAIGAMIPEIRGQCMRQVRPPAPRQWTAPEPEFVPPNGGDA
jgi:hypothetical protein